MSDEVLIIIPARSSSTRIKNKNLKLLCKKSLLEIKIKNCLISKIGKVLVSTDLRKLLDYQKNLVHGCLS